MDFLQRKKYPIVSVTVVDDVDGCLFAEFILFCVSIRARSFVSASTATLSLVSFSFLCVDFFPLIFVEHLWEIWAKFILVSLHVKSPIVTY